MSGNDEMILWLKNTGYLWSERIENAMKKVDRAFFVPEQYKEYIYSDNALPIFHGQTISAPTVVSFMLEKLDVKEGMRVLEVGTGSGYNTALLSELVGKRGTVITTEIIPELTTFAKNNIEKLPNVYNNIVFLICDGSIGCKKYTPFDRIIVTAAAPSIPLPLIEQLKEEGIMVIPVGKVFQDIVVYTKKDGRAEKVLPVMFVPLRGMYGDKY